MPGLCAATLSGFQEISGYKRHASTKDEFPQATYVRDGIGILASRILFQERQDIGLGIYTRLAFGDQSVHVCNMHGISRPVEKLDNPARLAQSAALIEALDEVEDPEDPVVVGGDLNVDLDTESVQAFPRHGYRHLIREYGIETTRNRYAWERFPDTRQYHSNYVFTKGVLVASFSIRQELVADNLAMELVLQGRRVPVQS
jgi:hypothetical protein